MQRSVFGKKWVIRGRGFVSRQFDLPMVTKREIRELSEFGLESRSPLFLIKRSARLAGGVRRLPEDLVRHGRRFHRSGRLDGEVFHNADKCGPSRSGRPLNFLFDP